MPEVRCMGEDYLSGLCEIQIIHGNDNNMEQKASQIEFITCQIEHSIFKNLNRYYVEISQIIRLLSSHHQSSSCARGAHSPDFRPNYQAAQQHRADIRAGSILRRSGSAH